MREASSYRIRHGAALGSKPATKLGVTIPPSLILRADQIID